MDFNGFQWIFNGLDKREKKRRKKKKGGPTDCEITIIKYFKH